MQKTSFLEPLQGIWSYACQPDGSRERRERGLNSGREKRRKYDERDSLGGTIKRGGRWEQKLKTEQRLLISFTDQTEYLQRFQSFYSAG